jgi:hypothetical protein
MKVDERVVEYFKQKKTRLTMEVTGAAVSTFNRLKEENKKVAGAFHLTC